MPPRRTPIRRGVAAATILLLATACAGSATIDELTGAAADRTAPPGLIAIAGAPVRITDSRGTIIADNVTDFGLQPTWSRDGVRVITSIPGLAVGDDRVEVFDGATGEVIGSHPAARPYFFFSWSHDGARIAALGNGRFGTTLDILDAGGESLHRDVLAARSLFLAWEPDGDRLVAHADTELVELTPVDGRYRTESLGSVGQQFYAPKWIPGTDDILYADQDGRLVRRSLDTGELVDLGEVRGTVGVTVHPHADRAALVHGQGATGLDDDAVEVAFSTRNAGTPTALTAAVEIVDLENGERTPVIDEFGLWAEWSPDGSRLLIGTLSADPPANWQVWDGLRVTRITTFVPSRSFFTRYVAFADQYVEQPRLWAPDSSAFVYGARRATDTGGVDEIHVVEATAAAEPLAIARGSAAFWSPAPPTS